MNAVGFIPYERILREPNVQVRPVLSPAQQSYGLFVRAAIRQLELSAIAMADGNIESADRERHVAFELVRKLGELADDVSLELRGELFPLGEETKA